MTREKIMEAIESLASCQGFYGRLLEALQALGEDEFDEVMTVLEAQNFGSTVDMVMYFEC